jgi:hypothetical protein
MNLDNLKNIIDNPILTDNQKRNAIYEELSKDENAIITILMTIDAERKNKKQLIADLNVLLSKSHVALEEPKLNKDNFVQKEISKFYDSGRIGHCFPKQK